MWLLILEAGIALVLLVAIVAWTLLPVKRREKPPEKRREPLSNDANSQHSNPPGENKKLAK